MLIPFIKMNYYCDKCVFKAYYVIVFKTELIIFKSDMYLLKKAN